MGTIFHQISNLIERIRKRMEKNNQKIMTSLHDYVNGLLNVPDQYGVLIAVLLHCPKPFPRGIGGVVGPRNKLTPLK